MKKSALTKDGDKKNENTAELRLFSECIKATFHAHFVRGGQPGIPRALLDEVSKSYPPFNDRTIDEFLPKPKERLTVDERGTCLHLRPTNDIPEGLPILKIHYDFSKPIAEVRIRMALFWRWKDGDIEKTVAFGYRFETPEGPGKHNHHHVQPIASMVKGQAPLPACPSWLRGTLPTFPLAASTPFELLACTLSSLYGPPGLLSVRDRASKDLQNALTEFARNKLKM